MTSTQVRQNIPNNWSQKVTCPLCSVFKMQVVHLTSAPDQLRCDSCGISIELELGGDLIHVMDWPEQYQGLEEDVDDRWISVEELRSLVRLPAARDRKTIGSPNSNPRVDKLIIAEINQTVESLHALGNAPERILTILNENEIDPQRVAAAREAVRRLERRERERERRRLRSSLVLAGVILVLMIGLGVGLSRVFLSRTNTPGTSLRASAVPHQGIPPFLSTLIAVNTAVPAETPSSMISGCPQDPAAAAAMFGGQVKNWSSLSSSGWVMLTTSPAVSIFIPKNMSAGYLQFSNQLNLTQVYGPATLSDIYYVAIRCR